MTEHELVIAMEAYWEAPGNTKDGIRAAIDAVDALRNAMAPAGAEAMATIAPPFQIAAE